jgi:uncharacterized membrane protein
METMAHQSTVIRTERVLSVDILRGLVMVIMALDHVRDFWGPTPAAPEDLSQTTVLLFFTRWITHLCAPTFIFLSGVSIYFYQEKKGIAGTSVFTVTRGLWLIVIEIVVMTFILTHSYNFILLVIFWVIGCSMILMAALIWLPRPVLIALSFIMIAFHNLWPPFVPSANLEYVAGIFHNTPFFIAQPPILVGYTIIPWVGVMLAGYLMAKIFSHEPVRRNRILRTIGLVLLALFVVLRAINVYGDPSPYSVQDRGWVYTVLSFLNVTKYPPSLQFLTLMIGISLIVSTVFGKGKSFVNDILVVFGRVPFFFFIVHFALISLTSYLWTIVDFGTGINLAFTAPDARPAEYEPNLARVYVVWIMVLIITWFPCRWFSRYKKQNRSWWISYF